MSRFYGSLQGNRGAVTRCGTPNSGLMAHVHGWEVGVKVEVHDDGTGHDVISVSTTGGSNSPGSRLLCTIYQDRRISYDVLGVMASDMHTQDSLEPPVNQAAGEEQATEEAHGPLEPDEVRRYICKPGHQINIPFYYVTKSGEVRFKYGGGTGNTNSNDFKTEKELVDSGHFLDPVDADQQGEYGGEDALEPEQQGEYILPPGARLFTQDSYGVKWELSADGQTVTIIGKRGNRVGKSAHEPRSLLNDKRMKEVTNDYK